MMDIKTDIIKLKKNIVNSLNIFWIGFSTFNKEFWPQFFNLIKKYLLILNKWLMWYENREKVRKYVLCAIIVIIVIIPFVAPNDKLPIGVVNHTDRGYFNYADAIVVPEVNPKSSLEEVLDTCFDCIQTNLKGKYTIQKVKCRNNIANIWLTNDSWYDYNDLMNIGNYMKKAYPDYWITIIYVRSWDIDHSVVDYSI